MTSDDGIKHWDTLESVSIAPGYRDASLRLKLHDGQPIEVNLRIDDSTELFDQLRILLQLAWDSERGGPLDARAGESRPRNLPLRAKPVLA